MSRLDEMDEYDSMFGRLLVDEDFLAAGYTPQEVRSYRGSLPQPSLTPRDRAEMQTRYGDFETPDYTSRQRAASKVQDRLIRAGLDPYLAGSYGRRIMGDTAPTDGGQGIGLADLTPLGIPFGIQEGSRTAVQGYQQGDPLQMGLGALEAGLGILEATPLTKAIGRGIAETASRMDPNTLYSVFGPPVGTRSPLRAPETGGGAGRSPLTFAEVERAMRAPYDMGRGMGGNGGPPIRDVVAPTGYERRGSDIAENLINVPSAAEIAGRGPTMPGAGMTNVKSQKPTALSGSYSSGYVDPELVAPVQSSISDIEGRTLMGIVGDTSGRQRVTQVNEDVFETPIDTQGGFQYIDRPGQGYAGAQSATSSKLNEASKTDDPLYISVLMGEQSPDFAVPTSQIFGQMLRNAPIATKNIPTIDEAIRGIGMSVARKKIVDGKEVKYSETIYPFGDFKSIGTPGYFDEYVAGLPSGTQRAALLKGLDKANLQKMGLPKVSDVRAAMMDEAQIGMDWGSTGYRAFTPDIERGAFRTTPDQSLTYQYGVDKVGPAISLTGQGRGIPYALTFPDLASELRAKGTGGGLEMTSPAYKVFEGSPKRAKQPVTPLVVDLVSTFREVEDRFGRGPALSFAADTLKDVNVTKEMIEAARRANAPTWMIAAMSTSAGLMATQAEDEGL